MYIGGLLYGVKFDQWKGLSWNPPGLKKIFEGNVDYLCCAVLIVMVNVSRGTFHARVLILFVTFRAVCFACHEISHLTGKYIEKAICKGRVQYSRKVSVWTARLISPRKPEKLGIPLSTGYTRRSTVSPVLFKHLPWRNLAYRVSSKLFPPVCESSNRICVQLEQTTLIAAKIFHIEMQASLLGVLFSRLPFEINILFSPRIQACCIPRREIRLHAGETSVDVIIWPEYSLFMRSARSKRKRWKNLTFYWPV